MRTKPSDVERSEHVPGVRLTTDGLTSESAVGLWCPQRLRVLAVVPVFFWLMTCGGSFRNSTVTPPKATPSAGSSTGLLQEDAQVLCDRVVQIKRLPYYDEQVDDPAYNALIKAGDRVIPCLIEKVADTTVMRNPTYNPGYAGFDYKVGDVALLVLGSLGVDYIQFLPPRVQSELNGKKGELAYFEYMQDDSHRRDLQKKLKEWYSQKQ